MKKRILLLLLVVTLLAGCTPYSELIPETPMDVLDVTMYVVSGGSSSQSLILGTDEKPVGMSAPTGLAALIGKKITYEVVSITENGDTAEAVLKITAPDCVSLVYQGIEGMDTYDEAVFTENVEKLLSGDVKTNTYDVTVQLQKVQGSWCLIINEQFSDAITGGLMSKYNEVQQAIYDAFAKGGDAK